MVERLVSVHLGRFMVPSGVLPTTQFALRRGLGTCDALSYVSHTLQNASDSRQEARIFDFTLHTQETDFIAAHDLVNHQRILYKLYSVNIGGSVLLILPLFLSNRSNHVMVDNFLIKLLNVASGVPQEVFCASYCYFCTPRSCFTFCRKI